MRNLAVVAPSPVPFRQGGAERLWDGLVAELRRQGIPVDLLKAPVRERTLAQLLAGYASFAEWDLSHFDQVITGKYPAWAVEHPNHRVWMLHPLRGLYDRYPTTLPDRLPKLMDPTLQAALELPGRLAEGMAAGPLIFEMTDQIERVTQRLGADHPDLAIPSPVARTLIQQLDHGLLATMRVRSHAAISGAVANRSGWFPAGVKPLVVHPPLAADWAAALSNLAPATPERSGPLRVLSVGRLEQAKRHDLAIRAVLTMKAAAKLRVVGSGPDADRLAELAGGDERVELTGSATDEELVSAYGWADIVCFTADREDYGLVALEALTAGRGVVATSDAGGALELLRTEASPSSGAASADAGSSDAAGSPNAVVTAPTASDLASALDRIAASDGAAQRMGLAARTTSSRFSWDQAIEQLIDPPTEPNRRGRDRPFVVALSTYPVWRHRQGGELRAFHLLSGIAQAGARVKVLSLTTDPDLAGSRRLGPNLDEETVLVSPRHSSAEHRMRLVSTTHAITDIAASLLWPATPELAAAIRTNLADASAAVLVQPFLSAALSALAPSGLPVVYDAHNHESTLKDSLLGATRGGRWLAAAATEAERTAVDLAHAIVTTTADDAELFGDFDGVDAARLTIIENGASVVDAPFTEGDQRSAIRQRLLDRIGMTGCTRLAVFVGSGHPPNVEAAHRIISALGHRKDLAVALIGRHSEMLSGRLPDHVAALGRVDDETLAEFLAGADVALNPVDEGSGSNLKLIDYFAAGVPVITTPVGARGVDDPRRFALIAPSDGLSEAIDLIEADPGAPERARAARTYAEEHLDWRLLGKRMADLTLAIARSTPMDSGNPGTADTGVARPSSDGAQQ